MYLRVPCNSLAFEAYFFSDTDYIEWDPMTGGRGSRLSGLMPIPKTLPRGFKAAFVGPDRKVCEYSC